MKKINFKEFKIYLDITHEKSETTDVRRTLGDIIYKSGSGVAGLDLAMRVFKSEGDMELSEEDLGAIEGVINTDCTPIFIDSFNSNLHD